MSDWRIIWPETQETVFEKDTLNVATAITASEVYGKDTWEACDPRTGPKALAAWVALAIAKKTNVPVPEAQKLVVHMSLDQMMAMLEMANGTGN